MSNSNNGQASEDIFVKAVEKQWGKEAYVLKLTDTKQIKGMMKHGLSNSQPCDFIVTIQGLTTYVEVKSMLKREVSFPFSRLQPAQKAGIRRVTAAKGTYMILIHIISENIWLRVYGDQILELMDAGINSIKLSNMIDVTEQVKI